MLQVAMLSVHTSPIAPLGARDTGGMNVYVRNLARHLGALGCQVDIFTRSQGEGGGREEEIAPRVRVIRIQTGPDHAYPKDAVLAFLPEFVDRVRCYAEDRGRFYDLIHAHYWLSGLAALELRRAWGTPVIQMFHTLGAGKQRVGAQEPWDRIQAEARIARAVDRVVAATPYDREELIAATGVAPERVTVVPGGVDTDLFCPQDRAQALAQLGLPPDHQMILFVGRPDPIKGLEVLLRALAILAERWPDWSERFCLAVVGGDPGEALRRLQRQLGLEALVAFLGPRDHEELPPFYAAACCCVVPSYYESFGLVALEAMACGVPVIASRVGGLAYTVQDGVSGLLVPPGDPRALAEALDRLVRDPELRARLGEGARRRAARFSWREVARQTLQLYGQVLGDVRRRGGADEALDPSVDHPLPLPGRM